MTRNPRGSTRREFIHALGAIGGVGAAYHGLSALGLIKMPAARARMSALPYDVGKGRRVIIIGAGLAGLSTAYVLARAGFKVRVLEANARLGGRSFTVRRGDKFAEDGGDEQECVFTNDSLYLNAGPGRIPEHHFEVLNYCRDFGVKLEPYIYMCQTNRLQNDAVLGGKPVPFRQIKFNLRGEIATLMAKLTKSGTIDQELTGIDKTAFLDMLKSFGSLQKEHGELKWDVKNRTDFWPSGYAKEPGAWLNAGVPYPRFDLETLLGTQFWKTGLFNNLRYYWQTTLLQPVGGMDMIWQAFLKQDVPASSAFDESMGASEGKITLENLVSIRAPVVNVRNTANGVEVVYHGRSEPADFCISTMAPSQLEAKLSGNILPAYRQALKGFKYTPAAKIGWEANRFWETEDRIYGGISWTTDKIKQIWYPSSGFNSPTGVLTAMYTYGQDAVDFGNMPLQDRFQAALAGGEKLHPGKYRDNVLYYTALSVAWQKMPHFIGGWAAETADEDFAAYKKLVQLNEQGGGGHIYLAGDYLSYWPGWQEGAITTAHKAAQLLAMKARALVK